MRDIPDEFHDLFEKRTFAHVTTIDPRGRPHTTPVWVDYDDGHVLVNTERERRKTKNAERNPNVSVSMTDPDDPYRFCSITGTVAEITEDGAREHIDELAHRYTGDDYDLPIQSPRVLIRVRPDEVRHS
ncbi:MAG: pyridoxamine 5'-phosphate oxidase family protein [Halarchaeum sp.]